ncbi:MAG: UDP-N-acetylenolpyruvoylglucosamine reductase, partial [Clostridiales bacterium]|nr:UDP-N-acetylenolpyruvoylglucosamine reductase [Clostridiales bacterium]
GLKGARIGGAMVSEKHCGFIVNAGNATAGDVVALINHIKKQVKEKFGVELQPEVKVIGEP